MNIPVIIIAGPTAIGKSAIAIRIARIFNGEVISADSRQVYKELNIGAGKITEREMAGVKHHMLDIVSVKQKYNVSKYQDRALSTIKDIWSREHLPIICGGTGFYIESLIYDSPFPEVKPNKKLRTKLNSISSEKLYDLLLKLDKLRAATIDRHNKVKLIRAIEIATSLGRVPPRKLKNRRGIKYLFIVLDTDDYSLKNKIERRLEARMVAMIKEGRSLIKRGVSHQRLTSLGLEYRYLSLLLSKKLDQNVFRAKLASEIWHYAKRQRTWFRRQKNAIRLEPTNVKKIEREISKFLNICKKA